MARLSRTATYLTLLLFLVASRSAVALAADAPATPNVVIIFCDDLGYGDLGCYGAKQIETPNLDRLAAEGMRFTDFHVAAAVCGASRGALLTGCYPQRLGILGAPNPSADYGIDDGEKLLSELLKSRGYDTAIVGKWHLGHHPQFLPTRHGFDEYFGLPYSNDMGPRHPTQAKDFPDLPLMENERVLETNPDMTQLTTRYTERAVAFIERSRQQPFFLYLAHTMPHVPLGVSDKFKGRSPQGIYGDVVMELDWSVGEVLAALARQKLAENTLVIFTSDNGPWLTYGNHAGSAGPLREGKGTTWEGGLRVPCIMRWPGQIPANRTCNELATTMDILPTIARLVGAKLSGERKLDGHDIWPLMSGAAGAVTPYEAFYYYWLGGLDAVRSGPWKLHFPHKYPSQVGAPGRDGLPAGRESRDTGLALYHLTDDIGETRNIAADHPDIVAGLTALAAAARADLGDTHTKRPGPGIRGPAKLK